jgi:hypothetical protein
VKHALRGEVFVTDLFHGVGELFVVDVTDPFEEQNWENVGFVVRSVDGAGDYVRGVPKVGF